MPQAGASGSDGLFANRFRRAMAMPGTVPMMGSAMRRRAVLDQGAPPP